MSLSYSGNIKKYLTFICIAFFLLPCMNSFAQKPNCNFDDIDGYFYHWNFDADNMEFDFVLENNTTEDIKNDISKYEIQWGDGKTTNVTNDQFPLKHTYSEGQHKLVVSITYKGSKYDYNYTVYNTKPTINAKIIEGDNGCEGQEFIFKLEGYETNPPSTIYRWSFGDGSAKIAWSTADLIANNGTITHTYIESSCISENNDNHFYAGAEPYIQASGIIIGIGSKAGPIIISKNIDINVNLSIDGKNKELTDEQTGCVNNTVFDFENLSDYGFNDYLCEKTKDHKWEVFKIKDGKKNGEAILNVDYVFETGNADSEGDVALQFLETGDYIVLFNLANSCNNLEEETGIISIYKNENTTTYTPQNFCLREEKTVVFTSTENPKIEAIQKTYYKWSAASGSFQFTEGTNSTSKDPKIKFDYAGKHIVHLEKTSLCGTEEYDFELEVSDIPIVSINNLSGLNDGGYCGSFTFTPNAIFTDNGKDSFGIDANVIDQYEWTFNNNGVISNSTKRNPDEITFSKTGSSSIRLRAHNSQCGWSDIDEIKFEIYDIPTPSFVRDDAACQDVEIAYTANPADMFSYSWQFGDGSNGSGKNTTHTYATVGKFNDQLTVISKYTCTNTVSREIEIIAKAVANAGSDANICNNDISYSITNASASNYSSVKWTTDGDGAFSDENVLHPIYTLGVNDQSKSEIKLKLTVIGNTPCGEVSDYMSIIITPSPEINIANTQGKTCENSSFDITGINVDNNNSIEWSSDKGGNFSNTNIKNPVFTPPNGFSGKIILTLTAYGNGSCSKTNEQIELLVVKLPEVDAGNILNICEGETANLSGTSSNTTNVWTSSGDGLFTDASALSGQYIPGIKDIEIGSLTLYLEAMGNAPCSSVFDTKPIYIIKNPTAKAGKDIVMCETESSYTIQVGLDPEKAYAQNYASLQWTSSGTGTFNNPKQINTTYSPSANDLLNGSVELTLVANPLNPCSAPASDKMLLSFTDTPKANAGTNITKCQTNLITLKGKAENYASVLWTTSGNGIFDDATKLETTYQPTDDEVGSFELTLTAKSIGLCDPVSDILELTLLGKAQAYAGKDGEICANNSYNLSNGSTGASIYSAASLLWQSKGDGSFDDASTINATYTPGSEDSKNGMVILQLTVRPLTPCADSYTDEMSLSITPLPTANAGIDEAICQGEQHEITSAAASNYSSVEWITSSADGYFENKNTLNPIYHPGKDDKSKCKLSLIVYGKGSCSYAEDEMELNITPAPTVSVLDKTSICEDDTYTVSGASVEYTPNYTWSTTGVGKLLNTNTLKPVYETAKGETGDFNLCLEVEGNGKCASKSACSVISIVPHPTVDAGNDDEVCANQVYVMNVGNAIGQVKANSWSGIDYSTSGDGFFMEQNGLHVKYVPGVTDKSNGEVSISIRANSINPPCDEFVEDDMTLKITPVPEVKAGLNDEICQDNTYQLLNATEQNTSALNWHSLNGGSFSDVNALHPTYTPELGKTGTIQLELTGEGNGSCANTSNILSLTIIPAPQVNAGNDVMICFGKNYELTSANASSFSSVLWTTSGTGTFTDPTLLQAIYLPSNDDYQSGKVQLHVVVKGLTPCLIEANDEIELQFAEAPFINAGEDDEICQNESYTIKKKSVTSPNGAEAKNVSSYVWETNGAGSLQNSTTIEPTYIPALNETGIIRFTLKANGLSNCDNVEDAMELKIIPTPKANFNIGVSCIKDSISFEDISSGGIFPVESWLWQFGDGDVSNIQNPSHEFGEVKEYKVSLVVTNNKGCKATIEKTARVNPLPEMKFTHEKIAAINTPVNFINECFNAVSYEWNFGEGSFSTDEHPNHTYTSPGVFTVELKAQSKEGCFDTISSNLEVIGIPEAGFIRTADGCGPLTVEFTNTSKGKFTNYNWDFGNGTKSTEANPDPVVYQSGILGDTTYLVTLTVENKAGVAVFKDKIAVKSLPIPNFEILPSQYGCSPVVRDIFNTSKGLPNKYLFDFGDGTHYSYKAKDVERPFQHEFTTGETETIYPITLTASNECGDRSVTKNLTVFSNTAVAVMKVDNSEGCTPFTVAFQNLSTGAGDYLESDWAFEDGNVEIRDTKGLTVYHTFEKAGIYKVQLTIHDTCATDQTSREIIVHSAKELDFDINIREFCALEVMQLSVPDELEKLFTNFTWDLGDGSKKTGANISHQYKTKKKYTLKLSAISIENGCEKNITKEITINENPKADFSLSAQEGCEPLVVNFTNNSSFADFYQWNFNDESKSAKQNPSHSFRSGNYTVSLIVESKAGCMDTITADVISRPSPVAKFELKEESACTTPFTLQIQNTSDHKELNSYKWDFGNNTITNQTDPIEETYSHLGKYNITLIAENQFLCSDTCVKEFNIHNTPVPGYEIISKTTCQGELIEFKDTSKYQKYTYWEFSDGYTSEGKNASHLFSDYGQYDLLLKVMGEGKCSDSLFQKAAVKVYPSPIADYTWENINTPPVGVQLPDGVKAPNNGLIQFTNWSDEIKKDWIENQWYIYEWNFDDSNRSNEKSPIHKYDNNGNFYVKLVAKSAYSCKDSITQTVDVDLMSSLFVPNAFNPKNPDPKVAQFLPKGIGLFKYQIEILDNWGNVVWKSDKIKNGRPAEGWDGKFKGKILPQGVYIWKIRAVFKNGTTWQGIKLKGRYHREGSVTLIQ
ncbi:MAG: hypothetical protein COC06_06355 [Bacteroidales bacterium]|nr:MAG: hypothetical protein COC06_06355 [Bacteroidales bacterium]